jgi:glycosyltransferase involved in cell wall biosynthesis
MPNTECDALGHSASGRVAEPAIDISVVVPVYNSQEYLEQCLRALLNQSYPRERYEIIMVDNNSSDGSAAILRKHQGIRLVAEPKQGAYAARNRGVAVCRGKLIAFTDADCAVATDWLQHLVAAFQSQEVKLVQGRRLYAVSSPTLSMLESYDRERADLTFSGAAREIYFGYTNNMAVRCEVFERCGPFVEVARGADSLFVHGVLAEYSPNAVCFVPGAQIRHLEITSVRQWLRKRFVYGSSFQRNYESRKSCFRLLSKAESLAILRNTIRREGLSLPRASLLIALLWAGGVFYKLGRIWSRARPDGVGQRLLRSA